MDRSKYDRRFISNGEVIGSYFLNVFYNELYLKARQGVADQRYGSITDGYRALVAGYVRGMRRPEFCNQVIQDLHKYYCENTSFTAGGLADFENRILSQFIPAEYFRDFTGRDKDANICAIIRRAVEAFSSRILETKYLGMIIDNRKQRSNIQTLQDILLNILIMQREEYYVSFAKKITSGGASNDMSTKLRDALCEMTRRKCTAEEERDAAVNTLRQVTDYAKQLENKIGQLQAQIVAAIPIVPVIPTTTGGGLSTGTAAPASAEGNRGHDDVIMLPRPAAPEDMIISSPLLKPGSSITPVDDDPWGNI